MAKIHEPNPILRAEASRAFSFAYRGPFFARNGREVSRDKFLRDNPGFARQMIYAMLDHAMPFWMVGEYES